MLDDVDPSPEVDDEERPQTPEPVRTAVSYHLSFRKYGHGPRNLRWAWLFGFGLATPKARGDGMYDTAEYPELIFSTIRRPPSTANWKPRARLP